MSGMLTRSKRKREADASETLAEPDRVGLSSLEQILLIWTIREKYKADKKYSEMTAYWVQKNFKALCYYKPKLIKRIDTTLMLRLTIYKNKLFSSSDNGCRSDNDSSSGNDSSSDKGSIRVLDADTHAHVATLEGHTDRVFCLTIYKNMLFSGSADGSIRVWDADTHAHVATLEGHTDQVWCLTIYKNKLFSGSADEGHTNSVCCLYSCMGCRYVYTCGYTRGADTIHSVCCLTIYRE